MRLQAYLRFILILSSALTLRWCVTYHPYSGQGKPPMFGDYEAQRHWQEITLNLPIENWYKNTTDNDLQYWGLDYPPLTAYHSLLLGHIANQINPGYIKLHESRGYSSADHKYFMRLSVLCADILVYIPAIIYFTYNIKNIKYLQTKEDYVFGFKKIDIVLLTSLIYPGLIMIDHGHFQYNCVSLGLFIAAVTALFKNSFVAGSVFFTAALNYKQMELYHALPIFLYILGFCSTKRSKSWLLSFFTLACVSFTVLFTFCIIWVPFLKRWETFLSVIVRLFPFSRGVFEDKVANIWCTINVVYKLRNVFTNTQLAQICLIMTTLGVLPCSINLYLDPSKKRLLLSLINSSLTFFLFSFQVHEKSILLVAVPIILYFHNDPFPCFWFLLVSHFSMLPLYLKDDLYIAYLATGILYFFSIHWMWPENFNYRLVENDKLKLEINVVSKRQKMRSKQDHTNTPNSLKSKNKSSFHNIYGLMLKTFNYNFCIYILFCGSIAVMVLLSVISNTVKPPKKYPDLFALLISVISCGHFLLFYLYFNYKQLCVLKTTKLKGQ